MIVVIELKKVFSLSIRVQRYEGFSDNQIFFARKACYVSAKSIILGATGGGPCGLAGRAEKEGGRQTAVEKENTRPEI